MKKLLIPIILILMEFTESSPPSISTENHRIIRVETTIHVVLSQDQFDDKILRENKTLLGYTNVSNGPVWVIGKLESGKMTVPDYVLGHEILHIMAAKDKNIKDPDVGKTKWTYVK